MSGDGWALFGMVMFVLVVAMIVRRAARQPLTQTEIDSSNLDSAVLLARLDSEAEAAQVVLERDERSQSPVGRTNAVEVFGCPPGTLLCIDDKMGLSLLYKQEGWNRCRA